MIPYGTDYCEHGNEAADCRECTGDALTRELAIQRVRRDARRILDAEERPLVQRPEVLTLRERLARPRDPVRWRIEGWQPVRSRIVLAAQFKAGKTTVTGNLARSLLDGDDWLGRFKVDPISGTVVILDFEMGADQGDDWLGAQRIVNDDRVIPIWMRGNAAAFDILDRGRRAEWAAELRRLNCGYLVLDCLRPVLDALGLDEHTEAGRLLVPFDALLVEADIAESTVVHHMGHTGERSRGDSRIRDWPDVEWRLVRQDADDPASPRFISAYGRDVEQGESQLSYNAARRHLTLLGGTRKTAAMYAAVPTVWAWLGEHAGSSGRAVEDGIAKETDEHARAAIRAALKLLVRQNWVHGVDGPKRSTLHRQCASAPCAPQCAADLVANVCECASAPIEAHTHALADSAVSAPTLDIETAGPVVLPGEARCHHCGRASATEICSACETEHNQEERDE